MLSDCSVFQGQGRSGEIQRHSGGIRKRQNKQER